MSSITAPTIQARIQAEFFNRGEKPNEGTPSNWVKSLIDQWLQDLDEAEVRAIYNLELPPHLPPDWPARKQMMWFNFSMSDIPTLRSLLYSAKVVLLRDIRGIPGMTRITGNPLLDRAIAMLTFDWVPRCIIVRAWQAEKLAHTQAQQKAAMPGMPVLPQKLRLQSAEYQGRLSRRFKASPINPESIVAGYNPSPRRRNEKRSTVSSPCRRVISKEPISGPATGVPSLGLVLDCSELLARDEGDFKEPESPIRERLPGLAFPAIGKQFGSLSLSTMGCDAQLKREDMLNAAKLESMVKNADQLFVTFQPEIAAMNRAWSIEQLRHLCVQLHLDSSGSTEVLIHRITSAHPNGQAMLKSALVGGAYDDSHVMSDDRLKEEERETAMTLASLLSAPSPKTQPNTPSCSASPPRFTHKEIVEKDVCDSLVDLEISHLVAEGSSAGGAAVLTNEAPGPKRRQIVFSPFVKVKTIPSRICDDDIHVSDGEISCDEGAAEDGDIGARTA